MTDMPSQKIVAWVFEAELLEAMFKRAHNISVGAEMIGIAADPTSGLVECVFEVTEDVFEKLSEDVSDSMNQESSEIYN